MPKYTKRQEQVLELSKRLPKMSKAADRWWRDNIFEKVGFYAKNGDIWCQCCGARYVEPHAMLEVSIECGWSGCPDCGATLKLKHSPQKAHNNESRCMTIATTMEGWQVLRSFEVQRCNTKGDWTHYECTEVVQNWVDPQGHEVVLACDYNRSFYHFIWLGGELKPRRWAPRPDSYYATNPFALYLGGRNGSALYPGSRLTSTLRRDGLTLAVMSEVGVEIVPLIQDLLKGKPYVEELLKTRQLDVLSYWRNTLHSRYTGDPSRWIHALRICNRNGYKVTDASMWFDHLELLEEFHMDTHNARYVCPADLRQAHTALLARQARLRAIAEKKRQADEAKKHEEQYARYRGAFLGLAFEGDNLEVRPLQSVADFVEEGAAMHHCVYQMGYYDHGSHPHCLIMSARDGQGHRIETVEVDINRGTIVQSRGACNQRTDRHGDIVKLVEASMPAILSVAQNAKRKIKAI